MLQVQIIPVTPFAQNCSVVWESESKEAVVIDAGGDAEKICHFINEQGLNVKALWVTHGHLDHIGAVGELAKLWQVPVIGPHKADAFWVDSLQDVSAKYGFPTPEPVTINQWLEGGDLLQLGEHVFEVRFAPGHTPGHIMFYQASHNLLWAGDVLFKESVGRTDFPQSSHTDLIASIHRECLSLPDHTQFIPGHGPISHIGHERAHNPFIQPNN
ncbi:MBL fold metallo-hydrolase [Acinetobacter boissieri]|uniref:Glyoxylase, beta-lactamase superfamily II n=1 Tax=Acinetobacter boissieri TaxID=1219383 RepID=A0A1G6GGH0_9GAMM|nr:MBL fold metallo-hydrolase [Acinetobacter boissieri]SDB81122.1 Glyoxylase, beta-lactamase superfamily II [Acinetobacter boissieri]